MESRDNYKLGGYPIAVGTFWTPKQKREGLMSRKAKSETSEKQPTVAVIATIVTAVLGLIGTVAVAYFQFYLPNKLSIETTQTAEAKLALAIPTLTPAPSATSVSISTSTLPPPPTSTSTPTPTNTLLPPPLVGVFPLVGDGVDFLFPEDKPDLVKRQFVEIGACLLSPPNGVQLTYNFTGGGGGGWGIHWANPPLKHLNLTGFTELTFWVKGTSGNETFQIGLKDTAFKEIIVNSERYVLVSSSDWKPVIVPLSHFADATGPVNFASIDNMSIGFSSAHGSGSICIDDIAFK